MLILLIRFWPLVLVLLALIIWWWLIVRKRDIEHRKMSRKEKRFWYSLMAIVGIGVVVALFVEIWNNSSLQKEGRYVSPRIENGQIIPGHVETK